MTDSCGHFYDTDSSCQFLKAAQPDRARTQAKNNPPGRQKLKLKTVEEDA
jgi:hypothetical protein